MFSVVEIISAAVERNTCVTCYIYIIAWKNHSISAALRTLLFSHRVVTRCFTFFFDLQFENEGKWGTKCNTRKLLLIVLPCYPSQTHEWVTQGNLFLLVTPSRPFIVDVDTEQRDTIIIITQKDCWLVAAAQGVYVLYSPWLLHIVIRVKDYIMPTTNLALPQWQIVNIHMCNSDHSSVAVKSV